MCVPGHTTARAGSNRFGADPNEPSVSLSHAVHLISGKCQAVEWFQILDYRIVASRLSAPRFTCDPIFRIVSISPPVFYRSPPEAPDSRIVVPSWLHG